MVGNRTPNDTDVSPETMADNHLHCRAKRTGFGDYVSCLETPPHDCGYALHLGDEFLCLHPHHLAFARETEAAQQV